MNTDKIYAEAIANEYSVKNTSKVVALRKLDSKVKTLPTVLTYVMGTVSVLLLGVGMCLCMGVLGNKDSISFIIGIAVGMFGIIGVSVNYPIYKKFMASRKSKYAGDIIRLASEISNDV